MVELPQGLSDLSRSVGGLLGYLTGGVACGDQLGRGWAT